LRPPVTRNGKQVCPRLVASCQQYIQTRRMRMHMISTLLMITSTVNSLCQRNMLIILFRSALISSIAFITSWISCQNCTAATTPRAQLEGWGSRNGGGNANLRKKIRYPGLAKISGTSRSGADHGRALLAVGGGEDQHPASPHPSSPA